ncbi:MAG: hypothetical protein KKC03_06075 [Bacteroidetes bacterium]|nr:hypothetical protein [Bacteroidota bacterium]
MKKNTINNQRVVHMALLIFKKLPIFLMTLALTQCDDRDVPMFETETLPEAIGFSQVGFDALPGDIQDAFGKAELLSPRTPSASRQGGRVFGEIQTKSINKIARPDGTISYTAAVRKVSEGFYYDNFVVHRDSLGQIQNYIIRYQPTEEWYYNSQGSYDYSNFSGFITFYKPDGNVLASSEFISGVPVARPLEGLAAQIMPLGKCEVPALVAGNAATKFSTLVWS